MNKMKKTLLKRKNYIKNGQTNSSTGISWYQQKLHKQLTFTLYITRVKKQLQFNSKDKILVPLSQLCILNLYNLRSEFTHMHRRKRHVRKLQGLIAMVNLGLRSTDSKTNNQRWDHHGHNQLLSEILFQGN